MKTLYLFIIISTTLTLKSQVLYKIENGIINYQINYNMNKKLKLKIYYEFKNFGKSTYINIYDVEKDTTIEYLTDDSVLYHYSDSVWVKVGIYKSYLDNILKYLDTMSSTNLYTYSLDKIYFKKKIFKRRVCNYYKNFGLSTKTTLHSFYSLKNVPLKSSRMILSANQKPYSLKVINFDFVFNQNKFKILNNNYILKKIYLN